MSAAIQSPNLSMGGRLELSHRVYSLLVNLLVYDSTPRDFLKGSENAGDGSMNNFFPFFIIPWAFNGTMPWISIRDHPLGLVHFIYCPSFSFVKDILAKAVYISKKGDFRGSGGSLVCPENVIDKLAFETRFVATRGIVSAFSSRDHPGSTGSL